jgi:uncharacterized protein (TIGR02266 family)
LSLRGGARYRSIKTDLEASVRRREEEKVAVSDPVTMARTARESLARGLNALQGDPNIPPQLSDLGQPIAQAMGALYKIEASRGAELQPHAQLALTNVQGALAALQAQPAQHPAVAAAMEAVAGALASVHALSRAGQAAAPAPQPQYAQPAPQPQYAQPAPAPQYAPPQQAYAPPAANPYAAAPQQAYAPPPQQQAYAPPQAQPAPAAGGGSSSGEAVAAELGAHSPSNFYKGLSGNDIVDHGGLFVSTYKLPKLGSRVRLRVSMPGGYEFEANAVVRWMREANEASTDAPPGFGAQFTDITAEARQLVYRYVRNREPMFHDDL